MDGIENIVPHHSSIVAWGMLFTEPLRRKGSSIYASMFISAGTCLLSRYLAINYSVFEALYHSVKFL
jgi:hypothetical protein